MSIANASSRALEAIGGAARAKMVRMLLAQLNSLDESARARELVAIQNLVSAVRREVLRTFADPRTTRRVQIELPEGPVRMYRRAIRPRSPSATPVLRTLMRDEDPRVVRTAIQVLTQIDPQAPEPYRHVLRRPPRWPGSTAEESMVLSNPQTRDDPPLAVGLGDDNPEIRIETARDSPSRRRTWPNVGVSIARKARDRLRRKPPTGNTATN